MQTEKFYFQVTVLSLRHVSTHFLKVKTLNRCSQGSFAARKDGLNISRFVYQCEAEWWLIRWRLQILFMSCASAKVNNMWYRFQEFVVSPTANSCNCRITRLEEKKKGKSVDRDGFFSCRPHTAVQDMLLVLGDFNLRLKPTVMQSSNFGGFN